MSVVIFSNTSSFAPLLKLADNNIHGTVIMPPQPTVTDDCLADEVTWQRLFNDSFIGPVTLIKQLIPTLIKQTSARLVLISGISSLQPLSQYATSNTLRTAWLGFTKTLADKFWP